MPKTPFHIKDFSGGLNTKQHPRNIADNQLSYSSNADTTNAGEVKPSGNPILGDIDSADPSLNYNALDVTYIKDSTLEFNRGTEIYVFHSDRVVQSADSALETGSETWIWTNPWSGLLFLNRRDPAATHHWSTIDPTAAATPGTAHWEFGGIPAILKTKGSATNPAVSTDDVCYYSADGQLRVINADWTEATYIGGSDAESMGVDQWTTTPGPAYACEESSPGHSTEDLCKYVGSQDHSGFNGGASGLWIGYIDNSILSAEVASDSWQCYPSFIGRPSLIGSPAAPSGSYNITNIEDGENAGTYTPSASFTAGLPGCIQLNLEFNENGDPGLLLNGRSFYISYTFDGLQETLPSHEILNVNTIPMPECSINQAGGPATPAGYEYDATTFQVDGVTSTFPTDGGTITVTDTSNYEQVLDYALADATSFSGLTGWFGDGGRQKSSTISGSGIATNVGHTEISTVAVHELAVGDVVTISGSGTAGAPPTNAAAIDGTWSVMGIVDTDTFTIAFDIDQDDTGVADYTINEGSVTSGEDAHNIDNDATIKLVRKDGDVGFNLHCYAKRYSSAYLFDPSFGGNRITHINVYTNRYDEDTNTVLEADFAHVCSFDISKGFLKESGVYETWLQPGSPGDVLNVATEGFALPFSTSYQMRTGVEPKSRSLMARFKSAVVTNRRVYAGNVKMQNELGVEQTYGDRMVKSPPNSFDCFPTGEFIDVAIRDGDDIVKLEEFNNRILQFKRETLYVINISGDYEFLEGTHKYRGISHPSCSVRTDKGVGFVNDKGIFFFDGQKITSLSGSRIAGWAAIWAASVVSPNYIIGYDASAQQLHIMGENEENSYIYDMETNTFGLAVNRHDINDPDQAFYKVGYNFSKPFNNSVDGKMSYYQQGGTLATPSVHTAATDVVKWRTWSKDCTIHATTSGPPLYFELKSKLSDFGIPIIKRIYAVRILYSSTYANGTGTGYQFFLTDGFGSHHLFAPIGSSDGVLTSINGTIGEAILYKDTNPRKFLDGKDFAIRMATDDGNYDADNGFKLLNVEIIYRTKDRFKDIGYSVVTV